MIKRASISFALMVLLASGGASLRAQILNGDFESWPPLLNWTVEWASVTSCQTPTWSNTAPPAGHPGATTIGPGYSTCGGAFSVDPYQATQMCRLNDAAGGCHATRIHQTFPLRAEDKAIGAKLGVEWGAHLQDPGHPTNCQPYFSIVVYVNGWAYTSFSANASDAAAGTDPGWQDVGCNYYYKKGIFCVDLSRCPTGASIKVQMTVADCGYCGHGGEAFLDNVRWVTGTPAPGDMVGWWADKTLVDVTPFNNDGSWVGSVPWWSPGYVQSGMSFACNPTPRYAVIPDDPSLDFGIADPSNDNGDFSIDAWVRPTDISGIRPIVSKMGHTTFTRDPGYQFYLEDGRLTLLLSQGGSASSTNFNIYTSVGAVTPNEWSFVGVSVDRVRTGSGASAIGEVKFYVNGRCLETEIPEIFDPNLPNSMMGSLENDAPLYLGYTVSTYDGLMFLSCTTACFQGQIDEVEIFSRALDCSEMTRLFQAGCCGKERCDPGQSSGHGGLPFWTRWCWIGIPSTPATPVGVTAWRGLNGNMFDVQAHNSIRVRGLEAHLDDGVWDVEVYSAPGSHIGQETNPAAWTLLGTANAVRSAGVGSSTAIPLQFSQQIPAGQVRAFYVRTVQGDGLLSSEGPNLGAAYERDQSLDVLSGTELSSPFTVGSGRPYLFNGSLVYEVTDGLVCDFCQIEAPSAGAPFTVNFADLSFTSSSTGIIGYMWDLDGDGITDSNQANPTFVYQNEGVYNVSLMVSDGQRTRMVNRMLIIERTTVSPTITVQTPPLLGTVCRLGLSSPEDANRGYLCGFSTGTSPGIALPHLTIPLNLDALLTAVFDPTNPISTLFSGTVGVLDGNGDGACSMIIPNEPAISGLTLYSAFVILDPSHPLGITKTSNPVVLTLQ